MSTSQITNVLKSIEGIVAISQFGSFNTDKWIEGRSDIDLAVIVAHDVSYMDTLTMEDKIIHVFENYYNYKSIHLTFILFKDFACKYARMAVDSDTKFIIDDEAWFDFQHYVLKYARDNKEFERKLKIDEQYTYFGGIIDESIL